jgi:hypothetical protein
VATLSLWYDIWVNGTKEYEDLKNDDFDFFDGYLYVFLEAGTEEILLEKGDTVEVRCK